MIVFSKNLMTVCLLRVIYCNAYVYYIYVNFKPLHLVECSLRVGRYAMSMTGIIKKYTLIYEQIF